MALILARRRGGANYGAGARAGPDGRLPRGCERERMSHHRVLVLYASTHGHTGKIADRLGALLREQGLAVRVRALGTPAAELVDLAAFDAVVLGGSVHAGHHQKALVEWIAGHRTALAARPTAFFSVSLTAADDSDEARASTRSMIDDVLSDTGWTPALTTTFAGALQFQEYNLPTRVLMRLIARRIEHQTGDEVDVHADTDYTDWAAVERFAGAVAEAVADQSPVAS
jgi:menaquinone-dependent protoporphyrinogen oxidase